MNSEELQALEDARELEMSMEDDEELAEEDIEVPEETEMPDLDEPPENAMGLAHQINKESETIKAFKDMPRETRFSFLQTEDKVEVKHHARAYRTWKYIEKIIALRVEEDAKKRKNKNTIHKISDRESLKLYLDGAGRDYLAALVDDLTNSQVAELSEYVLTLKPNYMLEMIEKHKQKMNTLYEEYKKTEDKPEYIDDMDNLGKVVDTTIISMGFKGNAAQHSVMTIQAVKNEDIQKVAEEKKSFSFMDAIKRRLG